MRDQYSQQTCAWCEAYHWKMGGINAEYPNSESPDPLIGVLVREEPEEEEDDNDDKEDDDEGYSE